MRFLRIVAVSLLLAQPLRAESVTVRIQETVVIEIPGATAAYTTNPDIADVTTGNSRLSITGYTSGTTQLMVITPAGTQSFLITVTAASVRSQVRPDEGTTVARYEGRYTSGAVARIQNAFDLATGDRERRSEFHFLHIRDLHAATNQLSDGIAAIFYRHTTSAHQLTLLDDLVDVSRMTVSNSRVRGLHLTRGLLELHAGYASPTMYDGLFLPVDRRWVAGAGYGIDIRTTRLIPSVYGFFSERADAGARRGIVGALTAEHQAETLFVRGEIGVSRSVAASGELRYASSRSQVRAFLSYKPEDFPTLGLADIRGTHAELDATRLATARLSLASHGSYDQLELGGLSQTIGGASVAFRYALTPRLALLGGTDVSGVRTATTSIRTIGLPLSAAYETGNFGLAASYRLLDHSDASRRGDTLRLSGHAGAGRFNASVWADRQRHAPTLELIFRAAPGLDLALLRLGITVRNPEDVARALRDNAALVDLGFITGVNVDLTPRRLQAGFNLGWLGSGPRSDHFRLLGVYSRDEGIRSTRESVIATLTYSRRILAATDLSGSYSWWRSSVTTQHESGTAVDIGVRQQFDGVPNFLRRSGTIDGFVFVDPEMRGVRGNGAEPLAGITVTLDGTRTIRTDSTGAYAFHQVSPGRHRIAAELPAAPRAFFTTPSHSETEVPAHVDFGLAWAAARIDGRVLSDAGTGIAGVVLSAVAPTGVPITATSDPEGRFVFAVLPGTHRIALAVESLPPGYSLTGVHERQLRVEADEPQSLSFEVQARRSIGGRAAGSSEVRIESLDRAAPVDANGNFLFRSMPSGTFTLTAVSGGHLLSRTVTLPAKPGMIDDVVFGTPPDELPGVSLPAASPRAVLSGSDPGRFRLQAGAFRLPENALATRQRIERLGGHVQITRSGALNVVTVGPFVAREAAKAEADRLRTAGIDTIVIATVHELPSPALGSSSSHVVQAGAFREERNVKQLVGQLQRSGEQTFTVATDGLTVVYVGPFPTRQHAVAASERLRRAGFDGLVTRR